MLCRPALWVPEHTVTVEETLEQMRRRYDGHDKLGAVLRAIENSGVRRRHLVHPIGDPLPPPGTAARTRLHLREIRRALPGVVDEALRSAELPVAGVDAIVFVSGAGFSMPPITSWMIDKCGFRGDVRQVPVTGSGYAAGAAAIRRAHDIRIARPGSTVLVVACEVGRPPEVATLLSGALPGDAIAAVVVRGPGARGVVLRRDALPVRLGPEEQIPYGRGRDDLSRLLGVPPGVLRHSREVRADYGDIASAAVPAVLQRFFDDDRPAGTDASIGSHTPAGAALRRTASFPRL